MGSGETSPTMVTPHQRILADVPAGGRIVLDTPFGFQENADELTVRLEEYFANSVGTATTAVTLRSADLSASEVAQAVAQVRSANWVFAGPGSPSYALKVWRETGIAPHFDEVLERGVIVLASAAALTAGAFTIPVYEIYKVGQAPFWNEGLNLLGRHTGLNAVVVPHFDNSEGGTHDTRFCYMGERRLRILEAQLPPDTFVLGVDEHTGVSFDLDTQVVRVFGRGTMTVRKGDHVWQVKSGEETTIDEIAKHGGVERVIAETTEPLFVAADQVDELLDTGNVLAAVDALLELDEMDRDIDTRATVHALITRLGQLAASPRVDLQSVVGPYIEALLQARNAARSGGRWDEADAIRDQLTSLHVTIKDTSDGSQWDIHSS
jgi:cyanophycinase-like exopeptidase